MRLRLAYFSPLPPARTGIADYSRALLPALTARASVALYAADPASADRTVLPPVPLYPLAGYARRRWEYDLTLYQMGNSAHHASIYDHARLFPGVVVLHDFGLHHFVEHHTIGQGRPAGYTRALGYAYGRSGLALAADVRAGRFAAPWFDLPLNRQLVDRSLAVVVHSDYAAAALQARRRDRRVYRIPALIESYHALRPLRPSNWPRDAIVFAVAGQVTRSKHVHRALRAFAALHSERPETRFLIIGEALKAEVDLPAVLAELGLGDAVHTTGFVPDLADFNAWIAGADVVINLRQPTVGETSATALRAMAAGRPLIVYDHGWYAELPTAVAEKVPPGDEEALLAAMTALAVSPERRAALGASGRQRVASWHAPAAVAAQLENVLRAYLATLNE